MRKLILSLALSLVASNAQAALIYLNLIGTAGAGLLPGNEPGTVTGGSGGEIANTTGITYDTDAKTLNLTNVGWGGAQGFTDMSSVVDKSHIHAAANANGNTVSGDFTGTGGVIFNLTRSTNAATGGVFTNAIIDFNTATFSGTTLTVAQREAQLLDGKMYINLHTISNTGGEVRGFLVVPEPSTSLLGAVALGALAVRRRRA
jgi:MYXO-CTERM domain-containing protein